MANKKTNEIVYKKGLFTGVYKGDNGNMLTATQMIYEVDGDEVVAEIENDFKLLYTFLYDQYRSFQSQQKDLFAEWPTVFMAIGRSYNTKSKSMVKLLEDCGLLKQIKMPNDNRRIKIIADVSLKNIRFVNPSYDAWRAEQKANNAERVAEYATFNDEKEKAKREAKQHQSTTKSKTEVRDESRNEIAVDNAKTPHDENAEGHRDSETQVVGVEPESKTLWQLHSHALITQNPKFNDLSPGHQSSVMSELSECNAVSYKAIKEVFNMSVAEFAKAAASKQTIKQVGRVCSGCYPVEVGNGWSCINNKCSNHNAEYENSKLDDMDSIPF
ncbi:DUF6945 domain-containing protein [Aeromonas sp. QDB18]|uniref:DUF6945 domain-containing protein n=1 Tax=Aeromonas sp. QDB18 TaxID=2990486 RepID=UPI0022E275D0|nr:hypothetical protein [Aeromonas sp. QDB18]